MGKQIYLASMMIFNFTDLFLQPNISNLQVSNNAVCGNIEVGTESATSVCQNKEYGCNGTLDCIDNHIHEETCIFSPCACPLPDCNYAGSSEQLSLAFSSKLWDCGRRFRYNISFSCLIRGE
jgi:hypothetical protein